MSRQRTYAWLVLILLAASFLRFHDLPQIPPGMTHDEADHGLDAWSVVQGERPIYFTVGYGREPLFDYSTAALMTFLGPTYLAGRLTAVFFSLLLISAMYAWVSRAIGRRAALLTAAALAVSFWPVMTARHALRSVTMPALFAAAVAVYWRLEIGDLRSETGDRRSEIGDRLTDDRQSLITNLQSLITNLQLPLSALLLGLTFYTYIPARLTWLAFPALLAYLWWLRRPVPWRRVALILGGAALVGLPLFLYLYNHPQAEVRVAQLAGPLQAALRGEWGPLLGNVAGGAGMITVTGDGQWRYNIAGRPLLGPVMGALFYVGLALALFRVGRAALRRQADSQTPGLFFGLVWLGLGLSPVLVTGPDLGTTQAIAAQPVLYLFPALALVRLAAWLRGRLQDRQRAAWLPPVAAVLLFALLAAATFEAYFQRWASHPEVAAQYEAHLVAAISYINKAGDGPVAISTDAPNRFHDPATAQLFLTNNDVALRWFDGRHSLLAPAGAQSTLLVLAGAPLAPALMPYLQPLEPRQISTSDAWDAYHLSQDLSTFLARYPQFFPKIHTLSTELSTDIALGDAARFLGYEILEGTAQPGGVVRLVTLWQVLEPPEEPLVLFSHVLGADGRPVAQVDRLDAPSDLWRAGDLIVQLHEIALPEDVPPGTYPLTVGLYPAADWQQRLPLLIDGQAQGDALRLTTLDVGS
ncbi:MAG TPA: hypothetical protein VK879_15425 [Candidatus Sulfomarinibacteraceae bacterium]|nr:hypothetical protein [Candidatus Sulfomarinibacteraceae bacterium]